MPLGEVFVEITPAKTRRWIYPGSADTSIIDIAAGEQLRSALLTKLPGSLLGSTFPVNCKIFIRLDVVEETQ